MADHFTATNAAALAGRPCDQWHVRQLFIQRLPMPNSAVLEKLLAVVRRHHHGHAIIQPTFLEHGQQQLDLPIQTANRAVIHLNHLGKLLLAKRFLLTRDGPSELPEIPRTIVSKTVRITVATEHSHVTAPRLVRPMSFEEV